MNIQAIAIVALLALVCTTAAAQTPGRPNVAGQQCDAQLAASRTVKLDDMPPFAGASYQAGMYYALDASNCVILAFYRLPPHLPGLTPRANGIELRRLRAEHAADRVEPAFYARRIADDDKGEFVSTWTSSATCPALAVAIGRLEQVASPRFTGPGPYRESFEYISDQPMFQLWAGSQVYPELDTLYTHELSMKSSGGATALSRWFDNAEKQLAPCWSSKPPLLERDR